MSEKHVQSTSSCHFSVMEKMFADPESVLGYLADSFGMHTFSESERGMNIHICTATYVCVYVHFAAAYMYIYI